MHDPSYVKYIHVSNLGVSLICDVKLASKTPIIDYLVKKDDALFPMNYVAKILFNLTIMTWAAYRVVHVPQEFEQTFPTNIQRTPDLRLNIILTQKWRKRYDFF